jgi:PTS system glucitol/sorbitol-specific IIA component
VEIKKVAGSFILMNIIKSTVVEIGELAYFDDYDILILFNDTAPVGIRDVSIVHTFIDEPNKNMLKKGSKICFNDLEYTVEEIGNVANETLFDLGHVSLYFGLEEGTDLMPGSVLLSPYVKPEVKAGDTITFIK